MARRKDIRSKQQYLSAYELEKLGDEAGAVKAYQKATTPPCQHPGLEPPDDPF